MKLHISWRVDIADHHCRVGDVLHTVSDITDVLRHLMEVLPSFLLHLELLRDWVVSWICGLYFLLLEQKHQPGESSYSRRRLFVEKKGLSRK